MKHVLARIVKTVHVRDEEGKVVGTQNVEATRIFSEDDRIGDIFPFLDKAKMNMVELTFETDGREPSKE